MHKVVSTDIRTGYFAQEPSVSLLLYQYIFVYKFTHMHFPIILRLGGVSVLSTFLLLVTFLTKGPTTTERTTPSNSKMLAVPHLPVSLPFRAALRKPAPVPADTTVSGLADALADVQRRSYFLDSIAEDTTTFLATNTAQHLTAQLGAATYTVAAAPPLSASNHVREEGRATPPAWNVRFVLRGLGRRGQVSLHPRADASAIVTDATIRYAHATAFSVDYVNSPSGVRQNYQVNQRPASTGPLQVLLHLETQLRVRKEDSTTLTFATSTDSTILRYSGLRAWDAAGRVLPAHLAWQAKNQALTLEVDDTQATYPVTIDPLASTPSLTLTDPEPNYSGQFGYSVAGAGDVNGDGYSDVIIGVPGSNSQGRAYLFLGSSSGLRKTPAATLTDPAAALYSLFGFSVAGAGDVNGDGYADVIIGAWGTNEGQGSAYLYLGGSAGLKATPSTTFNLMNPDSSFGRSVAGIGDVNGMAMPIFLSARMAAQTRGTLTSS